MVLEMSEFYLDDASDDQSRSPSAENCHYRGKLRVYVCVFMCERAHALVSSP